MNRISRSTFFFLIAALATSLPVLAEPHPPMAGAHGMSGGMGMAHGSMMGRKKGHQLSPHWSETLSDEQKIAIDRMHLKLASELAVLKAEAKLAEKELNAYTIRDDARNSVIDDHIDKLLAVKKKILAARFAHLREMRAELTPQQRISYDMGVLKRHGAK